MTAATQALDNARKEWILGSQPVETLTKIFKGIPVFLKAATKLAFTPDGAVNTLANDDIFAGIAADLADNSTGAASAIVVQVYKKGEFKLTFSDTLTQADVGKKVFVNNTTDDSVVSITSSAGNPECAIGTITQIESASTAFVKIDDYINRVADSVAGASDLIGTVAVTVLATATTGTGTVPAGARVIGIIPTGNQDQLIDNVAVATTVCTVTLAAAATADNTFLVSYLKA